MNRTVRTVVCSTSIFGAFFGLTAPALAQDEAPTSTSAATFFGRLYTPGGLTAEVAAARAAETSFSAQARAAELRAAAAQVDDALYAFFPRLQGTARYARLSNIDQPALGNLVSAPNAPSGPLAADAVLVNVPFAFPVILNQTTLEATLSVPLSDYLWRLPKSYAAASGNVEAAELSERASRLNSAHEARLLFYTWVRALAQVEVAVQAERQVRQHLRDAELALGAGTVSKADVLRVRSQLASAELLVVRAKNLADLTTAQLRVAMHEPSRERPGLGEDLRELLPPVEGAASIEALEEEAKTQRLELKAVDLSITALEKRTSATRSLYLPRIDAFATATLANPNQRIVPSREEFDGTWFAGLQATFTINDVLTARSAVDQLLAQSEKIAAERAALADGLTLEVLAAQKALYEAQAALATSARGLASAEESYRVRKALFQAGRATSVERTDAETDLTRAQLEAINAAVDQRVARAKLLHATGRDVSR